MRNLLFSLFLAVTLVQIGESASANELKGIRNNNQGVKNYMQEKPVEAFRDFSEALADLPFVPEAHFNLGNAFLVNKEFDKATREYREAIRLAPGDSERAKEIRFRGLFNSAVALTEQKRVDEALEAYQSALEIRPNSVEVKTNIELLTANGGGGESGEQQQPSEGDQEQKEGQGQQQQQQQQQQAQQKEQKQKPKPFKSEQLTNQDVGRILDELKRQEEQIRAKMEQDNAKDAPPEKDW